MYEQMYGGLYYEVYGHIFALELFICLMFFVVYQPRRRYYGMRALISFGVYMLLVTLVWALLRFINGNTAQYPPIFFFLVAFFLGCGVYVTFKTNFFGAIYYATGAYAVQHASYATGNIIKQLINYTIPTWVELLVFDFLIYCVIAAIFFMIFIWPRRSKFASDIFDIRAFVISLFSLGICVVLSSVIDNIFAEYIKDGLDMRNLRIGTSVYSLVGCAASLVIQFGFLRENKLSADNAIIDHLMHQEKKHHELSKETIDIINAKCHDLKHQLSMLEKIDNKEERKVYIDELKSCIAIYDAVTETGNDALDIVISEKGLLCENNNISFSYLVDGQKLNFMSSTDVASLFGNALDNAIERQLYESEDKRFISMSVKEEGAVIYVHIDNKCSDTPEFVEGLPQTTKADKHHHGFGTKSISNIVEKYSGELSMCIEDGSFNLDILFPAYLLKTK